MTKIQMIQTIVGSNILNNFLFLSLRYLLFEFVSNFDIRILNFANGIYRNYTLGPLTKADLLESDIYNSV
jgi:hypothetical protein